MRSSTLVMIGFAVLFGLLAVFVAQSWLNSAADARLKSLEAQKGSPTPTQTIVVAAKPLRFGNELTAAVLHDGMKAVTIRVTDIEGVAGFVLPGDRVDIALTRLDGKGGATTDVVLQDAQVLAIDQSADERAATPSVAKSVTLEVDTTAAQKLDLAASLGTLSLLLRKAGDTSAPKSARVSLNDLFSDIAASLGAGARSTAVITVKRGTQKEDYSVPVEGGGRSATANSAEGHALH